MADHSVLFSDQAYDQVDQIDAWWRTNRPAAPDLFWQELEDVVALLALLPLAGQAYRHPHVPGVRRHLLRSSRYHVYYVVSRDAVVVLAVWSAIKGGKPPL